jgi:hypothetical protein
VSRLSELDKSSNSQACIRIPLQAGLQFSPIHRRSMDLETAKAARRRPCIYARAAIRGGTRNPVRRLDRRFAKIRSPAKSAASSGLWRQPTLFGIDIVRVTLTGQLSSCAWKLQMKARAKNRCHAPMMFVRAARIFDHGQITVTWRRGNHSG